MLELYAMTNYGYPKYDAPVGSTALLLAFNDRARSCKSSGYSELWSDAGFKGIGLCLIGDKEIPWLGRYGLDMAISSTITSG